MEDAGLFVFSESKEAPVSNFFVDISHSAKFAASSKSFVVLGKAMRCVSIMVYTKEGYSNGKYSYQMNEISTPMKSRHQWMAAYVVSYIALCLLFGAYCLWRW